MNDPKITTTILTGFLGSGKTSLLKSLLEQPDLADTAVLINEFGEVGIDHLLVQELDEDVVLLQSGCLCCTIRGDLKAALTGLHERRARGQIPDFSRLVIETTGLADPAPIVATLSADPVLRYHFQLGNIVTVVDALNGPANLEIHEESTKQAATADRLIVSKIDLASNQQIAATRAALASLNPTAEIVLRSETDPAAASLVLDDLHNQSSRAKEVDRWLAPSDHEHNHDPNGHDPNRHGAIQACLLESAAPLDWASFGLWLSMLLNRHGASILRVKGLLALKGMTTPIVIHGVQHTIHKPVHLDRWPDHNHHTRIVVIAKDLDPSLIQRSFSVMAVRA